MSQETINTQETKKDSGESALGTPADVLSQENFSYKLIPFDITQSNKQTVKESLIAFIDKVDDKKEISVTGFLIEI